jgi:hypothetical protein
MWKMKKSLSVLVLISCFVGYASATDMIQNGSFELYRPGAEPISQWGIMVSSPSTSASLPSFLPGWTVTSNWGAFYWYWATGGGETAQDGNLFLNMCSGGGQIQETVSQSFPVFAGATYEVSYYERVRAATSTLTSEILLGAGLATGTLTQIADNQTSTWQLFSYSFKPDTDTTATLKFYQTPGAGAPDNGVFLDNVKVIGSGFATNPRPVSGSIAAMDLALLEWDTPDPNIPGNTVTSYVYWGTEPNMAAPHWGLAPVAAAQGITGTSTVVPEPLEQDKMYYWTVETHDPSRTPARVKGLLWSFNTVALKQVAHWTMDSADGGVYADSSPEGHNAVVLGNPNIVSGILGNAAQINATDGVGNAGTWDPSALSGKLTASCWVKWDGATSNQVILSKADDWQNPGIKWLIGCGSAGNVFVLPGNQVGLPAGTLKPNEWTFIAFTFDGTSGTLYAPTVSDTGTALTRDSGAFLMGSNDSAVVWIGARGSDATTPAEQFTGLVGDVQLFNYDIDVYGIIGMYNAVVEPDKNFCVETYPEAFDMDGNCKIDLADFAKLAANWLSEGLYPSSL